MKLRLFGIKFYLVAILSYDLKLLCDGCHHQESKSRFVEAGLLAVVGASFQNARFFGNCVALRLSLRWD